MGVFASDMSFDVPLLEHILMAQRTVMLQCFSDPGKIYNVKPGTSFKSRTNPRIKQQRAMVRVARGYLMVLIAILCTVGAKALALLICHMQVKLRPTPEPVLAENTRECHVVTIHVILPVLS